MDKLTAIKIKYDDGTYSDEIPVSVLSENVEWDSTHTLVDILGSVDVNVTGTIQDQISQLFNEKVNATDLSNYVNSTMKTEITTWLNKYISPATGTIAYDASLSIEGAAADAKAVGNLKEGLQLENQLFPIYKNIEFIDSSMAASVAGGFDRKGNWYDDSSQVIDKHRVSAGEIIYISSGFNAWQFRKQAYMQQANDKVGPVHINDGERYVVVPSGVQFLIVSKSSNDSTNYVKKINRLLNLPLHESVLISPYDFVIGSYTSWTPDRKVIYNFSRTRIRTASPFKLEQGRKIHCNIPSGYNIAVGVFKEDLSYIKEIEWTSTYLEYTAESTCVVLPVIRKTDDSIITASEAFAITIDPLLVVPNNINSDNLLRGLIVNGKYMDLDGIIKNVSAGSTWCYSEFSDIEPNTVYNLWSFIYKDKKCHNIYINYFDINKIWINSLQLQSKNTFTTPTNCYFIVISGSYEEANYLYLTKGTPMFYKRYGQDTLFNTLSKYNRSVFGNTVNWAKMGVNFLGKFGEYPIYPHGSKWSFISAVYEGFDAILIDVIMTSDGKMVISHENNLYPFAKTVDGASLTNPWNITEHTLAEVESLDMGYDYGPMYRGTKILTLDEALSILKILGVTVVVEPEIKFKAITDYENMVKVVAKYGFKKNVIFFSYFKSELATVADIIPEAQLLIYAGETESYATNRITDAISLKTDKNKVIINAFANKSTNVLTEEQIQRMVDNDIYYSVSTPSSEPTGFLSFMKNAPMTSYITHFGTLFIPAYKMLWDNII